MPEGTRTIPAPFFWLNSKDEDSLKGSFVRMARRILKQQPRASGLGEVNKDTKSEEVVDAVKRWLDQPKNTGWLMIYDSHDNPTL